MAILEIKEYGEPVLREKSLAVKEITPEILNLIRDMAETMYTASGVGLAAPQVGVTKRIIIIDGEEEGLIVLVNPMLVKSEGEVIEGEGCLSIPGVYCEVKRSSKVTVKALNESGEPIKITKEGLLARALQHEIDHLEGILFVDRIGKVKRQLLLNKLKKQKN
ncbi:MAG: peptide deformylase [Candidatus Infernicultor aquiphilus]|uniref:Peptide deformylase n=1 Tax=Candidatus Infernicultor aquiphilus TaxID=1805029 RepID=A0A2M7PUE5_9BACT|nr:MAG: peptide deformylase [Candidatus Atribacteria bacterium CG_4_10_14_3_um_filter_34_13]PJB55708.1 MAG: peptide deformylase [Candidatus Atribacteria bacterium CG_4_9_14_3_um_filter_33_16]